MTTMLTDGYTVKSTESLLKRMAEINDNADHEWIISQLKANKVLLEKIILILDEVDPQGIICQTMDATGLNVTEEYEPEAESIILRLSEWKTIDDIEKIIAEEFAWWFYLYDVDNKVFQNSLYYKLAARKIWNAWMELKGDPQEVFTDKIELPPRAAPIIIEIE